jgi:hypothetical protein
MSRISDEELLKREHYAVIITETKQVWHEGDQRSRDAPGHGYPAGYETFTTVSYLPFETAEHVANWVKFRGASDRRSYRIIKAQPMKVSTTIGVSVSEETSHG